MFCAAAAPAAKLFDERHRVAAMDRRDDDDQRRASELRAFLLQLGGHDVFAGVGTASLIRGGETEPNAFLVVAGQQDELPWPQ